jgi:hypothetical protein
MKKLCIALSLAVLAPMQAAEEAPARPGFFQRAWQGTKKVGEKAAGVVASPFKKKSKGREEIPATGAWKKLEITMKLDPAEVRLPDTRAVLVIVTVVNKGKDAVQLEFPSSLRIDVVVNSETGQTLSRWSDDQRIDKEPAILVINPEERLEYNARISTREMTAGGRFEIEAYFPSYEGLRVRKTVVPVR